VFICMEQRANDFQMDQLMPLPPHDLLRHQNPEWFCLSGTGLCRLSWYRGHRMGVSCVVVALVLFACCFMSHVLPTQ